MGPFISLSEWTIWTLKRSTALAVDDPFAGAGHKAKPARKANKVGLLQNILARINRIITERFFNTDKLIIFRQAI